MHYILIRSLHCGNYCIRVQILLLLFFCYCSECMVIKFPIVRVLWLAVLRVKHILYRAFKIGIWIVGCICSWGNLEEYFVFIIIVSHAVINLEGSQGYFWRNVNIVYYLFNIHYIELNCEIILKVYKSGKEIPTWELSKFTFQNWR